MASGIVFEEEEIQRIITNLVFPIEEPIQLVPRQKKKRVLILSGPTACGKTALSLLLAQGMAAEIISADSMQVYRGMDIGTAKISQKERQRIPHHLIDIRDVDNPFNVVDFYYEARNLCAKIHTRDAPVIVAGGAGFYLRAFLFGPPSGPPSVPSLRSKLEEEIESLGNAQLYERLYQLDPDYAKTITINDKQKIVRGLEIISLTHEKVSTLSWQNRLEPQDYDFHCWFLYRPRDILYQRIEKRCEAMLEEGLIEEVRGLIELGLENNPTASQAIGYKHVLDYLKTPQQKSDYEHLVHKFKVASRRYAKRQFTWFRKQPFFRWLNVEEFSLEQACDMIIQEFESRE